MTDPGHTTGIVYCLECGLALAFVLAKGGRTYIQGVTEHNNMMEATQARLVCGRCGSVRRFNNAPREGGNE